MSQISDADCILNASPYPYVWMTPDLTIVGVNRAFLRVCGRERDDLVGRHAFDVFPADPNAADDTGVRTLRASLELAVNTGQPDTIPLLRYAIPQSAPGGAVFEDRYWSIVNTPVLNEQGNVTLVFQNPIDVTELYTVKKSLRAAEAERDFQLPAEGTIFDRSKMLEQANRRLDAELAHLRRLFDQAPGFVCVLRGSQHVYEMANEAYYQLIGHRDLIGKPFRQAIPEVEGQGFFELADRAFATGEASVVREMRGWLQREPGSAMTEIFIDMLVQPFFAPDGTVSGIFVQGNDVTDRKHAQDELRISNERWKLAVEGTGDGVWDWDIQEDKVMYSARWKAMLGFSEDEIGDAPAEWEKRVHPDDLPDAMQKLHACMDGTVASFISEHRLLCRDGSWKWVSARAIVVARDAEEKPLRMTGMLTDITEKKESDEVIWRHANFDTLTGLPNRRLFRDRLDHEIKKVQRSGLVFGLLFIDLDRFKEANDLLGHDVGDLLLKQAALRIGSCVRESDTVARLGGDEFTVILTELHDDNHVEETAQKILVALSEPFHLANEVVQLSGSVGITLYPADAANAEDLLKNADQAMYGAKNAGKNQFSYFTHSMQERAHSRLKLSSDLRHALDAGELQVYYQPVVHLPTGRIVKAEALLRWHHSKLGWVDPARFIPLAEESGAITDIGDWVFRQAALCSQRWSARLGVPMQISVNRSPVQFLSKTEAVSWSEHLRRLGLSGACISVEITEGVLLKASATVAQKLREYRDAGIQVAIDDFGTGYSSMSYLKKYDIDYLKIDQSFVHNGAGDAGNRTIAESMIVMAHKLGLMVIAEGIETPEQKEWLVTAGCDFGQGFLFSKAVPAEEFERLLEPLAE